MLHKYIYVYRYTYVSVRAYACECMCTVASLSSLRQHQLLSVAVWETVTLSSCDSQVRIFNNNNIFMSSNQTVRETEKNVTQQGQWFHVQLPAWRKQKSCQHPFLPTVCLKINTKFYYQSTTAIFCQIDWSNIKHLAKTMNFKS